MSTCVANDIYSLGMLDEHALMRFCVPLLDPLHFESALQYHCSQYQHASKVKNPQFQLDLDIYQQGKFQGRVPGPRIKGDDIIECKFTDVALVGQTPTLIIAHIMHPQDHTIDPYAHHRHRDTGVTVTHPMILFMGMESLGSWLSAILDNALFWGGITVQENLESVIVVMNPYDTSMRYQVTIFGEGETKFNSEPRRLLPHSFELLKLEELFPQLVEMKGTNRALDYSVCVSSQYSTKALYGIRHRQGGYFTTLDHLHEYCFR
jgi:hypothetical protein